MDTPQEANEKARKWLQDTYEDALRKGKGANFLPTMVLHQGGMSTVAAFGGTSKPGYINLTFRMMLAAMYLNQPEGPRCLDGITVIWDGLTKTLSKEEFEEQGKPDLNGERERGVKVQDVLFVMHCTPDNTAVYFNEYDTDDNIFTWGKMRTQQEYLAEFSDAVMFSDEWTYAELTKDIEFVESQAAVRVLDFPQDIAVAITAKQIARSTPEAQAEQFARIVGMWDSLPDEHKANAPEGMKDLVDRLRNQEGGLPTDQFRQFMEDVTGLTSQP